MKNMGGHDHGHGEPIKIPDWRMYKIEDVPELKSLQKALASQGLRDPWLRNEVWKFTGGFEIDHQPLKRFKARVFRGFKYGLIAAVITAAAEKTYLALTNPHGHEHH